MRFIKPPLGISDSYVAPNEPVSPFPVVGAALNVTVDPNTLSINVTPAGSSAFVINMLTGYLYFEANTNVLRIEVSFLNKQGQPQPSYPLFGLLREKNPQLMPLPAQITYEFPSAQERIQPELNTYIASLFRNLLQVVKPAFKSLTFIPPILKGRNNEAVFFLTLDELMDALQNKGAGLLLFGGTILDILSAGENLVLTVKDFKNYSAIDQPLAIIGDSIPAGVTIPSVASITALYKVSDTDSDLNASASAPNYKANVIRVSGHYKIITNANDKPVEDFKNQLQVVVHFNEGGTTHKHLFMLDRFEKWALFESNLRWHVKNWVRSGFLPIRDQADSMLNSLYTSYPSNLSTPLDNYPEGSRSIPPPEPTILPYADGETQGIERPIYDFDVQRLRWFLNRHSDDGFSKDLLRGFTRFKYAGADGLEEYVKRVATSEINFAAHVAAGPEDVFEVKVARELEAFKSQLIASRGYFLHRWISDKGLRNFIATDYDEVQQVGETANFQVHKLQHLNLDVRKESVRRLYEEAFSDTWGQVVTFRGQLADSEFFAGNTAHHATCSLDPDDTTAPYKEPVHTKFGIDCSLDKPVGGHGRGFSQNGSKTLARSGLFYPQVIHWYYYAVQLRNGYAQGDVLTLTPDGHEWVIDRNPFAIPIPAVRMQDGYWVFQGVLQRDSAMDWFISHDFKASQFCQDINDRPINLRINATLVRKLQRLRHHTQRDGGVGQIRIDINGVIDVVTGNSVRVTSHFPTFRIIAEAEFGASNVTPRRSDQWDLSV